MTKLQSPTDGATTFTYDAANRPLTKTEGNYELYGYDACNEQTSIGYWWADGTQQNALTYSYDPAGNVQCVNQGFYATTYGYDGADQLTSETSANGSSSAPPTVGYTYDKNGNRLTQTSGGAQVQSFSYDAHDKLTSGTSGNETDGYDANGNETSVTIGGGTYHFAYDDEDRLTSLTFPGGTADTFSYNGLGLRVGKTDSTGSYAYICDGTSPGSSVLSDGAAIYTPGLSENRGGTSRYYSNDLLGNLWTIDGSAKSQAYYQDTTGFGTLTAFSGSGSVFGYGGGNGCQTDADSGLVLMGHRYYDTRIGRFITQDHAKSGGNWYAYADNDPLNETDPSGLDPGHAYAIEGISAAQAFEGMVLASSSGLLTKYQYYSVDLVTTDDKTGKVISSVHEFDFAVPVGQDIGVNYQRAFNDRDPLAALDVGRTDAYFSGSKGNGIGHGTTGDYKDQSRYPRPTDMTGREAKELAKLLDHGGNFNGGMVAEGYGTFAWENPLIGAAAKSISDKRLETDDATGQGIFNIGWQFAQQGDPNSILNWGK